MKEKRKYGWMIEHYGIGTGIFTVYHSKEKAEYEFRNMKCECTRKPFRVLLTYTPKDK